MIFPFTGTFLTEVEKFTLALGKSSCLTPFSVSISAMAGPLEPQNTMQVSRDALTLEYLRPFVTVKELLSLTRLDYQNMSAARVVLVGAGFGDTVVKEPRGPSGVLENT